MAEDRFKKWLSSKSEISSDQERVLQMRFRDFIDAEAPQGRADQGAYRRLKQEYRYTNQELQVWEICDGVLRETVYDVLGEEDLELLDGMLKKYNLTRFM